MTFITCFHSLHIECDASLDQLCEAQNPMYNLYEVTKQVW